MIQVHWDTLTSFHFDMKELLSIVVESVTKGFPEKRARVFIHNHWYFAIQCSIAYMLLIFGIKHIMKNRKPFYLQWPLNFWNAFVALFAIATVCYRSADFFGVLWNKGLRASYCGLYSVMEGSTGLWGWLFILSKLPLLADTVFIVLRKKPLLFRHWFHHVLTFLHCFFTYSVTPSYNRWTLYLNICSIAITYSYYFFSAIFVLPGAVSKAVTTEQLIQFVISIIVLVAVGSEYYILDSFSDCTFDVGSFWMASFMYLAYLVLIVQFFLKSHGRKGGKVVNVHRGGKVEYEILDENGNKKID